MMFTRILVPLDGSAFSEAALPHAEALARCFGAKLLLAQVVDKIDYTVFVTEPVEYQGVHYDPMWSAHQRSVALPNPMAERAEAYLKGKIDALTRKGIAAEYEVLEGHAAEALLRHIECCGVDGVVMSTHGRGGVARVVIGSVADRLSRHCHIPVLLVRPGH